MFLIVCPSFQPLIVVFLQIYCCVHVMKSVYAWFNSYHLASNSFHKICNQFFIHHCQGWMEGLFLCETIWSLSYCLLVRLSWNLSPKFSWDSTIRFQQEILLLKFSINFLHSKALLFLDLRNFALVSVFFSVFILRWKNPKTFTQVLSLFLSNQGGMSKKKTQKKIYGRKARTISFQKNKFSSLFCSRSGCYYTLFLQCFDLKFLPDIPCCVYWVLAEIWASNSFHKIWNEFFIHHCQGWKEGSFTCEIVWSFSNWILLCLSRNFSPKLCWNSSIRFQHKIILVKVSRNFLQSKTLLFPNLRNFALVSAILLWVHIALKKSKNIYTSNFVCGLYQFKEAHPKRKHKNKDIRKKSQHVLFSDKQVFLFSLLSVCDLLSVWDLFLGCFDIKNFTEIPYCVY